MPTDLLHYDPTNPAASQLSAADWTKILGNDPANYDYTGIDPRMAETYKQRPIAGLAREQLLGPRLRVHVPADDAARLHRPHRQRRRLRLRREHAARGQHGLGALQPEQPDAAGRAKAYPTFRELYLAKLMGSQGVVSSLCPIDVTPRGANDPLYGYRPAMASIITALTTRLGGQCFTRSSASSMARCSACCSRRSRRRGRRATRPRA